MKWMRNVLFLVTTQQVVAISYLLVPSSGVKDSWPLNMDLMGCPEKSVKNYYYSIRNNPEEHSCHTVMFCVNGLVCSQVCKLSAHTLSPSPTCSPLPPPLSSPSTPSSLPQSLSPLPLSPPLPPSLYIYSYVCVPTSWQCAGPRVTALLSQPWGHHWPRFCLGCSPVE